MGVRLPTILGKAIDDVWKTLNQESDEDKIVDLVNCVHRMEDLMQDLQGNSKLRPIIDDGAGDVALWNKVSTAVQFLPSVLSPVAQRERKLRSRRRSQSFSEARTL
jgi:hypothetical protein